MFEMADKGVGRIWVEDGDPTQNCTNAKEAMSRVCCQLFKIPPRSPDLNPIENLFNVVSQTLRRTLLTRTLQKRPTKNFNKELYKL